MLRVKHLLVQLLRTFLGCLSASYIYVCFQSLFWLMVLHKFVYLYFHIKMYVVLYISVFRLPVFCLNQLFMLMVCRIICKEYYKQVNA